MMHIVLTYNNDCEQELVKMGYKKEAVYTKWAGCGDEEKAQHAGYHELAGMKHPPYQFAITSFWGMEID